MSIEFHENERAAAAQRLHWHLSRAASYVLQGLVLGSSFEQEMLLAERARSDWHAAQTEIMRLNMRASWPNNG